ncbi:MAG TPA: phage tail sheath subtilisin-like domain-containing protein, partial [Mariniphaga sp.]|nr:phage tail sheath subtilisin-like domain-containing protein [Mariniphaga sp.]
MATQPTYPGVYVEEIPSGVRTISVVATSIAAFIGRTLRGPVNDPVTINNYGDYERIFGGLAEISPMSFAVRDFYLNGGGQAIIVRLLNDAGLANITLDADDSPPGLPLILEASSEGSWGSNLFAHVDWDTKDPLDEELFNLTIYEKDPVTNKNIATEKFLNVSVNPTSSRFLPRWLQNNSQLVRVQSDNGGTYPGDFAIPGVRPNETFTAGSPPSSPPSQVEDPVQATSVDDGDHIDDNQFVGAGLEGNKEGLYSLEKADLFNLLVIPPYANNTGGVPQSDEFPTDVTTNLISHAISYCEKRRAMMLIDSHSTWTNKDAAKGDYSDGTYPATTSKNAALFFPRIVTTNPLKEFQLEEYIGSGAVAGIFARIDGQRGVWKSPAGQEATLRGVAKLTVPLTDDENGELNPLGINCLRTFPVFGRLVWGARTLEGADKLASEWKYIAVRR